jgi:hypothetical protein
MPTMTEHVQQGAGENEEEGQNPQHMRLVLCEKQYTSHYKEGEEDKSAARGPETASGARVLIRNIVVHDCFSRYSTCLTTTATEHAYGEGKAHTQRVHVNSRAVKIKRFSANGVIDPDHPAHPSVEHHACHVEARIRMQDLARD